MIEGPPISAKPETDTSGRRHKSGRAFPLVAIDDSRSADSSVHLLREFERTGDAAPFEAFMRRHAAMVYATCLKVTRDPHDAEDATQATFLTLASKSRLNGEIRQPEAWLRKVAHRLSLDLIRSKKRRINRENLRSEMTSEEAPLDSSDHAGNGELKGILNEELAKLPASYRMPLILHYFGGLSREEMAVQLKLKPSTLGVRLHRAREQLRKRLSTRGIALPSVAFTALLTETVRNSVCSHLMSRTAEQASAIALGQASAPVFTAGPGVHSFRLVTDLIGGSKLKVLLSSLVLGSAISITSGQVHQLLPKFIRDLIPSFRTPSIPKIEFKIPAPRLVADAQPATVDPFIVLPATPSFEVSSLPATPVANAASSTPETSFFAGPIVAKSVPIPPVKIATAAVGAVGSARGATPYPEPTYSAPPPVSRAPTNTARPLPPAAPVASRPVPVESVAAPVASSAPNRDTWNSVLPAAEAAAAGVPNVPSVADFSDTADAPEAVTSAVVGSVPEVSSGGGGGGGAGAEPAAVGTASGAAFDTPARSALASRTATFAGTTANYGGYADSSWTPTKLTDLSNSLSAVKVEEMSFSVPTVPTDADALSVNGARVTLRNATADEPVAISFVDTASTAIPALPAKHRFIGVWELDTTSSFEAIDLLVRYDDLRATRLGLNEQLLKLWVSDGETWTLMWLDPTFGRDVYKNLLWVSADSDVKFFAVSAPEPATLTMLVAACALLAKRRRND